MNIFIIRAFVKLREVLATNKALAQRIEQPVVIQKDHSALFDIVIKDIQTLDKKLAKEANCASITERAKRINWGRWAWS